MKNTTPLLNNVKTEALEPWLATSPMPLDGLVRETEMTWITENHFPKGAQLEYPIYELSLHPQTGALVAMPMEVSNPKPLKKSVRNNVDG